MNLKWETEEILTIPILVNEKDTIFREVTLEFAVPSHYQVTLRYENQILVGRSWNYFGAFCEIRGILEPQGFRFLCYGASRNYYPSFMMLDMGEGRFVSKMTIGQVATKEDTIGTFETGDDIILATLGEQHAFYEAWIESPITLHIGEYPIGIYKNPIGDTKNIILVTTYGIHFQLGTEWKFTTYQ